MAWPFTIPQSISFIYGVILRQSGAATEVKRKVKLSLCTSWKVYRRSRGIALVIFMRARKIANINLPSSCLSVRPFKWNNSAPTGRMFMKFGIWIFLENLPRKSLKSETNDGYFTWRPTFVYNKVSLNSCWNGKHCRQCCRENKKKLCSILFLKKSCLFEIIWKNMVKTDGPQMTV
jgi:hypothetical protein